MLFSDSIQYDIPKPNKDANYDSFLFNGDDTLSDDTSSQGNLPLSPSKPPSNPIFQDPSSFNDSGFQSITKPHQNNPSYRRRHQSQVNIRTHHNPLARRNKTH